AKKLFPRGALRENRIQKFDPQRKLYYYQHRWPGGGYCGVYDDLYHYTISDKFRYFSHEERSRLSFIDCISSRRCSNYYVWEKCSFSNAYRAKNSLSPT